MSYDPKATVANYMGAPSTAGPINLLASAVAGVYEIFYYFNVTSIATTGTVSLTLGWNDGVAAQSFTTSTLVLTTLSAGAYISGSRVIRSAASQPITYSTTVAAILGSPMISMTLRVIQIEG